MVSDCVGLDNGVEVSLLSGRCCAVIIDAFMYDALESVKDEILTLSARQLGKDEEDMCRTEFACLRPWEDPQLLENKACEASLTERF